MYQKIYLCKLFIYTFNSVHTTYRKWKYHISFSGTREEGRPIRFFIQFLKFSKWLASMIFWNLGADFIMIKDKAFLVTLRTYSCWQFKSRIWKISKKKKVELSTFFNLWSNYLNFGIYFLGNMLKLKLTLQLSYKIGNLVRLSTNQSICFFFMCLDLKLHTVHQKNEVYEHFIFSPCCLPGKGYINIWKWYTDIKRRQK